jgi:two-component system sensor histidine kinase UhpB
MLSFRGNLMFLHISFSIFLTALLLFFFYFSGTDIQHIPSINLLLISILYLLIILLSGYIIKTWFDKRLQVEKNNTLEIINRFEAINNATNDAVWDHDLVTGETFYNNRLLLIFGYTKEDVKNNESWWFDNIHPDDRDRVKNKIDKNLKDIAPLWQDEYMFRCKDGTYKIVKDRSYIVRDITGKPLRLIGAMNDITNERTLQQEIVQEKLDHKNELGKAIIQAHEAERKILREELHEDINQILASVKLCIHQISNQMAANDLVNNSISQLDEVIFKIRHISNRLAPSGLEFFGLISSIKDVIIFKESIYPVQIHINHSRFIETGIDKAVEILLYRVIINLINNMFFSSGQKPTAIEIEMMKTGEKIEVTITDNCHVTEIVELMIKRRISDINNMLEMYNGKIEVVVQKDKSVTAIISL